MDKKYQVFVSSTYMDLIEARQEVMQALLELDCIPVGMELFPAADDDQWTLIKELIVQCDYYILILAGRYGSIGPGRKSYTQMEYEYAHEQGIPIISFLHENTAKIESGKCESDPEAIEKLEQFREAVKTRTCRFWESPQDLGSKASRSLVKLIKSKPRIGWMRADVVSSDEANAEIARLQRVIKDMEKEIWKVRTVAPEGAEKLKQGDDLFEVRYKNSGQILDPSEENTEKTWNDWFYIVAPLMIDDSAERTLKRELASAIASIAGIRPGDIVINSEDFQTLKVQFLALGLIRKSEKKRSLRDSDAYWELTPFGETKMIQLRALKR